MSDTLKDFSFLNRWFIFRRRSIGRRSEGEPLLPLVDAELPLLEAELPLLEAELPLVEAELPLEEAELPLVEAIATNSSASVVPVGTLELVGEEELQAPVQLVEPPVAAATVATAAPAKEKDATLFQFYHRSAQKDDFKRKDPHWRRYLSTYAPFNFQDKDTPSITYPTFEAVLGAEKFKVATNKKELGPQIFGSLGTLHQSVATRLAAVSKQSIDKQTDLLEEQGDAQRDAQKAVRMKDVGAKWNGKLWDAAAPGIMSTYLRQRLEKDEHFRRIIKDVKAANGVLVYHGGGDLGGKVSDETVTGENLYGKALMSLFPLV